MFVVGCWLMVVGCLLWFVVVVVVVVIVVVCCCLLLFVVVCRLSFVVCRLSFVVCCLLELELRIVTGKQIGRASCRERV